jgi:hypothetical protein
VVRDVETRQRLYTDPLPYRNVAQARAGEGLSNEKGERDMMTAMKQPPMCNYPSEGFCSMTKEEYARVYADHKGGHHIQATETTGAHRVRSVQAFIARRFGAASDQQWGNVAVYLTDEKRKDPPPPAKTEQPRIAAPERVVPQHVYTAPEPTVFDAMKDTLRDLRQQIILIYEWAMLQESGGTAADKWDIQIGGRVLVRGEWVTVLKVNKVDGKINSLSTARSYVSKVGIEEVKDYQPPSEEETANVKTAHKERA